MAVKKSTAPKSSSEEGQAAAKKAAPKKAAPKKAAPKKAAPKDAKAPKARRQEGRPQEGRGGQADRSPEEAAEQVADTKDAALIGTKGNAKMLERPARRRSSSRRARRSQDYFRYHITKLGEKHARACVRQLAESSDGRGIVVLHGLQRLGLADEV